MGAPAALIEDLTDAEVERLAYDWPFWARAAQRPPADWRAWWLILAGRGFGKTRTGAETVREEQEAGRAGRIALVAPTAADARDVMVEGESGILATAPRWNRPLYEPSKRRVTWPNGAIATLYSADEPERLRGPQHDFAWADEVAAWRYPETFDQLRFGLRLGGRPRGVATTTPKPLPIVRDLLADPATVVTRGSTYENAANLPDSFLREIRRRYEGTRLGRQELNAEVLDDVEGALWTLGMVEACRITPEQFARVTLGRTVVAIDPNVTGGEGADEAGVVAGARGVGPCPCGGRDCGYVLRDASGKMPPVEWARRAAGLYRELEADRVLGEANNGGDLIEAQLRVVAPDVSYAKVHASKTKRTRAEPVAALYEPSAARPSRVHHVGPLPRLEDQLTQWVPDTGQPSPGRLDALVWAMTDLMLGAAPARPAPRYYSGGTFVGR